MFDQKYIAAVIQLDTNTDYEHNLKAAADFIGEAHARRAKVRRRIYRLRDKRA